MKNKSLYLTVYITLYICLLSFHNERSNRGELITVRPLKDTVGFARYAWQMDSLMARIKRQGWKDKEGLPWKLAICPHDDYTYVGSLYPEILQNIKAPNLIL